MFMLVLQFVNLDLIKDLNLSKEQHLALVVMMKVEP